MPTTPADFSTRMPTIIAMLKAPRAGIVKTRLAQEIGAQPAALAYRRLVEHQIAAIPPEWPLEIHFSPDDAESEMRHWLGEAHTYHAQSAGGLGERLVHAIADAFSRGARGVLVIGGDCPGLDHAALQAAGNALQSSDAVIGPAVDGGYYLIGLRHPAPRLFENIPWSSAEVLEATLARIQEAGLSRELLAPKEDVDDLASWRRLQALLPPVISRLPSS
jgi:rSAM/selenodomain-associated transferase 1